MNNNPLRFLCPSPTEANPISYVYEAVDAWIRSPALARLVACYASDIPGSLDTEPLLKWLLSFSDRWDFRRMQREATAKDTGEGARWLISNPELAPEQQSIVEKCASELGLIGIDAPRFPAYDYVLVLGGARLSCLLRTRLAAELVARQNMQPKAVALLASERPVSDSERDVTDTYAPHAASEFDLIVAGAKQVFQLEEECSQEERENSVNPNMNWRVWTYPVHNRQFPIVAVSAPSAEPDRRRANSADTYEFFLDKFEVEPGASLLLVTSQIYVPYQQLEAIRTLAIPRSIWVDTVGFPTEWAGSLQGMTGTNNYLQEVRSTIQAMDRFLQAFPRKEWRS